MFFANLQRRWRALSQSEHKERNYYWHLISKLKLWPVTQMSKYLCYAIFKPNTRDKHWNFAPPQPESVQYVTADISVAYRHLFQLTSRVEGKSDYIPKAKHIINVCRVRAMIYAVWDCSAYIMKLQKVYNKIMTTYIYLIHIYMWCFFFVLFLFCCLLTLWMQFVWKAAL